MKRIKRNALNRGTAEHLSGARVRFTWACGCSRVETIKAGGRPLAESGVKLLVRNWKANGVVLEQCRHHPDFYSAKKVYP